MPTLAAEVTAQSNEFINIHVYGVKFFIKKNFTAAWGQVKFEGIPTNGKQEQLVMELPIISIWVDGGNGNAVKVHLQSLSFDSGISRFTNFIRREGGINYGSKHQVFTCDRSGSVIRYGVREPGYQYQASNNDNYYSSTPIYDSKAEAIKATVDEISSGVPLGGLDLINFDAIPDSFMEQMGFEQIPDELKVSLPMWKGDAKNIARSTRDSYSYGGYGYEKTKQRRLSFLDLLETALNS